MRGADTPCSDALEQYRCIGQQQWDYRSEERVNERGYCSARERYKHPSHQQNQQDREQPPFLAVQQEIPELPDDAYPFLPHGSLFEFNRVSATAAKNAFATTKAPTTFNQFGATVGGPIVKNKTFFFADYQGIRDRRGDITRATIPTAAFRTGDLSASPTDIYDPATGDAEGGGRVAFANKRVPDARISPITRRVLGFIPPPTFPGLDDELRASDGAPQGHGLL